MSAAITDLIERLKGLDYSLSLEGEKVRFRYAGAGEPPEEAKAILDAVREHKAEVVAHIKRDVPRPYLDESGDLVIPFNSDPRYHWWNGGQGVEETISELTEARDGHEPFTGPSRAIGCGCFEPRNISSVVAIFREFVSL